MNKVETGLAELRQKYQGVIFEVTTTAGMEAAREARRDVREPRLEVERIRKAAKAPLLALGKQLDGTAARITAELEKIEEPIHAQIVAEEQRKEREKEARIAAELARVEGIQARIEELRGCQTLTPANGSRLISEHISDLERIPVDDSFAEFRTQAEDAKLAALARLNALLAAAIAHEEEQERIRAERAELARLRAEQAERDRLARETQAKADADAAAERARLEALARAEREAEAAAQAEANRLEREWIEAERAENARIAGERRAELDRQEAIARQAREAEESRIAAERADLERQQAAVAEANRPKPKPRKAPSGAELMELVAKTYQVEARIALGWLLKIKWDQEKVA
jgi:hypothetical protein